MRLSAWSVLGTAVLASVLLSACDIPRFTAKSTAKVLVRAQPSLKSEADYELAARAIPGALKTIEGFWVVAPDDANLTYILMEGFCQYGTGFVEDEVEQAEMRKDLEAADYHRARATKMFLRCMNYALLRLGKRWQENLFKSDEDVDKLLASTGHAWRTAMMWTAIGLASAINNNKDRVEMIGHLDTAKKILRRIVELDEKHGAPRDKVAAAMPHIALGMAYTGLDKSLGGDPDLADKHFQKAIDLTEGKFLLAQVLRARRVAFRTKDRKGFHDSLVKVLETDPSIWPEQRLANEIAHRRARRYLKQEQELFP